VLGSDRGGMSPLVKRALHWAGSALGLAGVLFVALRLHHYAAQIDFGRFGLRGWVLVGALMLTYGAANVLLARAWWQLLGFLGASVVWGWAVRAYGLSQLAKYLPGNIFHLAGRQALGLAAGLPAMALAKSAMWELGLISGVGALFTVLALPLLLPEFQVFVASVAFACALAFSIAGARHWLGPPVALALSWQAAFLAVSGCVFVGTLVLVVPQSVNATMLPTLCGAHVIAWLAGLLTPGAPAGVGVREIVLLFLLAGRIAEADLLLVVVLGRMVTVVGDTAFFAFAILMSFWREFNTGRLNE
jgi:glycosyltransferase 2 family protein